MQRPLVRLSTSTMKRAVVSTLLCASAASAFALASASASVELTMLEVRDQAGALITPSLGSLVDPSTNAQSYLRVLGEDYLEFETNSTRLAVVPLATTSPSLAGLDAHSASQFSGGLTGALSSEIHSNALWSTVNGSGGVSFTILVPVQGSLLIQGDLFSWAHLDGWPVDDSHPHTVGADAVIHISPLTYTTAPYSTSVSIGWNEFSYTGSATRQDPASFSYSFVNTRPYEVPVGVSFWTTTSLKNASLPVSEPGTLILFAAGVSAVWLRFRPRLVKAEND